MGFLDRFRVPRLQKNFHVLESAHARFCEAIFKSGLVENALNVGDKIPVKELVNCYGERFSVDEVFRSGPLVLKFFAGTWSAACVGDLEALQESAGELAELKATVVAVCTEGSERLARYASEHDLGFHLVSDRYEELATKFGLLVRIPEELAQVYRDIQGIRLAKHHHGKAAPEIALPVTYVVDRSGVVVYAHFSEDLHARPDVGEVVQVLRRIGVDPQRYQRVCAEEDTKATSFLAGLKQRLAERRQARLAAPRKIAKSRSLMSLSNMDVGEDPFRFCLAQEEFVESFKSFLKKTYCLENLLFYLESSHFRLFYDELPSRGPTAARIFKTYIRVGADLEVNIDEDTREGIAAAFRKGLIYEDLFHDATREIFRLMEEDSFPKWQRTKDFRRVWKRNGSLAALAPSPHFL